MPLRNQGMRPRTGAQDWAGLSIGAGRASAAVMNAVNNAARARWLIRNDHGALEIPVDIATGQV